jgi:hypothetical protein
VTARFQIAHRMPRTDRETSRCARVRKTPSRGPRPRRLARSVQRERVPVPERSVIHP